MDKKMLKEIRGIIREEIANHSNMLSKRKGDYKREFMNIDNKNKLVSELINKYGQ